MEKTYTITQAARHLGISYNAVIKRVHKGEIKATKIGRSWRIPESELMKIRQQPNRLGQGTNAMSVNISDDLYKTLQKYKSRINMSALFEAGMWVFLAEIIPEITFEHATNQARKCVGNNVIMESIEESVVATMG